MCFGGFSQIGSAKVGSLSVRNLFFFFSFCYFFKKISVLFTIIFYLIVEEIGG